MEKKRRYMARVVGLQPEPCRKKRWFEHLPKGLPYRIECQKADRDRRPTIMPDSQAVCQI